MDRTNAERQRRYRERMKTRISVADEKDEEIRRLRARVEELERAAAVRTEPWAKLLADEFRVAGQEQADRLGGGACDMEARDALAIFLKRSPTADDLRAMVSEAGKQAYSRVFNKVVAPRAFGFGDYDEKLKKARAGWSVT